MDRLTALRAYVRLVELGSFSEVAAELGVTQSTVSKWIAALEEQLSAQLVERTTRSQRVTEAGKQFYDSARGILASYESAVAGLVDEAPVQRGRLRVNVPVVFGQRHILGPVAAYLTRYPQMELELSFSDHYINLVDEGVDLAVRVGRQVDSSFRTRKLGQTPRRLVASPEYVASRGAPCSPMDLVSHDCLLHSNLRDRDTWRFGAPGQGKATTPVRVRGRFAANNSEALLAMARSGHGVALLASWLVDEAIRAGHLVPLLTDYTLPAAPIHALLPPGKHVRPQVRTFLDFLAEAMGHMFHR